MATPSSLGENKNILNGVEASTPVLGQKKGRLKLKSQKSTSKARSNAHIVKGIEFQKKKEWLNALLEFRHALKLRPRKEVSKKIDKMKRKSERHDLQDDPKALVSLHEKDTTYGEFKENVVTEDAQIGEDFCIAMDLYERLYPYQREGLKWLYQLHTKQTGGILGDDMGMGKTIQISAFLKGLFDSELIKTALIAVPTTLIDNWRRELKTWCPHVRVFILQGTTKRQRQNMLDDLDTEKGICIVTYGLVRTNVDLFNNSIRDGWDYFILDEGHQIKDKNRMISKAVRLIKVKGGHKLILSGTPLQNNLSEYWSLFDFVTNGTKLGDHKLFMENIALPIKQANMRGATSIEKRMGQSMGKLLQKLTTPHFLRRDKNDLKAMREAANKEIEDQKSNADNSEGQDIGGRTPPRNNLPKIDCQKNDIIVWVKLNKEQAKISRQFAAANVVKKLLYSRRSPLAALTILKKICDHPRLLSTDHAMCQELDLSVTHKDDSIEVILDGSSKMRVCLEILKQHKKNGHRVLLFSQSKLILNMFDRLFAPREWRFVRIDGDVKIDERQAIVDDFNSDKDIFLCLLTTRVGGLGLNLTSADRVIIYDPCWNPAVDAQAVDRAYRIGQTKNVAVSRLMTCGTIEEKIYRRQVMKTSLWKTVSTKSSAIHGYFSKKELREVFELEDLDKCQTLEQFQHLSTKRNTYGDLEKELGFVQSIDHVIGVTDHDLLFGELMNDFDGDCSEQTAKALEKLQLSLVEEPKHSDERKEKGKEIKKEIKKEKEMSKKKKRRAVIVDTSDSDSSAVDSPPDSPVAPNDSPAALHDSSKSDVDPPKRSSVVPELQQLLLSDEESEQTFTDLSNSNAGESQHDSPMQVHGDNISLKQDTSPESNADKKRASPESSDQPDGIRVNDIPSTATTPLNSPQQSEAASPNDSGEESESSHNQRPSFSSPLPEHTPTPLNSQNSSRRPSRGGSPVQIDVLNEDVAMLDAPNRKSDQRQPDDNSDSNSESSSSSSKRRHPDTPGSTIKPHSKQMRTEILADENITSNTMKRGHPATPASTNRTRPRTKLSRVESESNEADPDEDFSMDVTSSPPPQVPQPPPSSRIATMRKLSFSTALESSAKIEPAPNDGASPSPSLQLNGEKSDESDDNDEDLPPLEVVMPPLERLGPLEQVEMPHLEKPDADKGNKKARTAPVGTPLSTQKSGPNKIDEVESVRKDLRRRLSFNARIEHVASSDSEDNEEISKADNAFGSAPRQRVVVLKKGEDNIKQYEISQNGDVITTCYKRIHGSTVLSTRENSVELADEETCDREFDDIWQQQLDKGYEQIKYEDNCDDSDYDAESEFDDDMDGDQQMHDVEACASSTSIHESTPAPGPGPADRGVDQVSKNISPVIAKKISPRRASPPSTTKSDAVRSRRSKRARRRSRFSKAFLRPGIDALQIYAEEEAEKEDEGGKEEAHGKENEELGKDSFSDLESYNSGSETVNSSEVDSDSDSDGTF